MAYWHGFGGLHMHTDATIDILDNLTTLLGQRLRDFKLTTCAAYVTRELNGRLNSVSGGKRSLGLPSCPHPPLLETADA